MVHHVALPRITLRLSVLWVVAALEQCPYKFDTSARHQLNHSWASEPRLQTDRPSTRRARAAQRSLDQTIAGGHWARGAWVAPGTVDVARTFAGRRVLLLGGSTTRRLVFAFVVASLNETAQAQFPKSGDFFVGAGGVNQAMERRFAHHGWRFHHYPCEVSRGYGCSDCHCGCRTGGCSGAQWLDFEARHGPSGTVLDFSWKPELYSQADVNAFTTRWAEKKGLPYDIIQVGKGLHDAAFRRQRGLAAHGRYVVAQARKFGPLLGLLPTCSLVVIHTPYVDNNGNERAAVSCTRHALARLAKDGEFGKRSVLMDAFALTAAPGAPRTFDRHHYQHPTHTAVWRMMALALEAATVECPAHGA